ncbi:hypothetical protein ID866_8831 [Astraeus odoratus]|nr:hypothetical protein ID866_8831 [Astraeus odoratus]
MLPSTCLPNPIIPIMLCRGICQLHPSKLCSGLKSLAHAPQPPLAGGHRHLKKMPGRCQQGSIPFLQTGAQGPFHSRHNRSHEAMPPAGGAP